MKTLLSVFPACLGLLLAGCVGTGPNTQQGAVAGAMIGGLAGAVIGNNSGHHNGAGGAAVGAVVGAIAGGTLGNAADHASGTTYTSPEQAATSYYVEQVPVAPPPQPEVVVMAPGAGYLWIPGCWVFAGQGYVWQSGYWALPPRPGYRYYVAPHWEHRGRGQVYLRGYWR